MNQTGIRVFSWQGGARRAEHSQAFGEGTEGQESHEGLTGTPASVTLVR